MIRIAHTVLGPIPVEQLGVIALHESLLSVVPGAEYAYDIEIDRAQVFQAIADKLRAFKIAGGGTIVDSTGMFHGRDVRLYEHLSHHTGVHIVASTGMGPEAQLGGYFLTPQTNPPTPWPAARFAELFGREITDGMVVPRVERRGSAGLITTTVTATGPTPTDESLLRGAARASVETGVPLSIRYGADAAADLAVALSAGITPDRVLVGGLDRIDATAARAAWTIADAGAWIGIDHVGTDLLKQPDHEHLSDAARAALVAELVSAGHGSHIILSSNATGTSFGYAGRDLPYTAVLTDFLPLLRKHGVSDADIRMIIHRNPREFLAVTTSRHDG